MPYTYSLSERGWACFPHVCTLGFYEVEAQTLSILSQDDSSQEGPRRLNKRTSLSMVNE